MGVHHIAEVSQDNTRITPKQILEMMLRDLENGETSPDKVLIIYTEPLENGGQRLGFYAANVRRDDHIVMCELSKIKAIESWRD